MHYHNVPWTVLRFRQYSIQQTKLFCNEYHIKESKWDKTVNNRDCDCHCNTIKSQIMSSHFCGGQHIHNKPSDKIRADHNNRYGISDVLCAYLRKSDTENIIWSHDNSVQNSDEKLMYKTQLFVFDKRIYHWSKSGQAKNNSRPEQDLVNACNSGIKCFSKGFVKDRGFD